MMARVAFTGCVSDDSDDAKDTTTDIETSRETETETETETENESETETEAVLRSMESMFQVRELLIVKQKRK